MGLANPRTSSEAPSDESDFYTAEVPEDQPAVGLSGQVHHKDADKGCVVMDTIVPGTQNGDVVSGNRDGGDDDDDDSSSLMDLSEPSRPATPEHPTTSAVGVAAIAAYAGTKRKLSVNEDPDNGAPDPGEEKAKRPKVLATIEAIPQTPRTAGLPPELWQRVFVRLSPPMLCRCLRVCKDFNFFLTGMSAQPVSKRYQAKVQAMDGEAVWARSRKTYFPELPRPLDGLSELEMLKLVGGRTCQFCARQPVHTAATSHLSAGPGATGVRVIWPFHIRSCGPCLEARVLRDVQVLSNPIYGSLRLGVPHAFRSADLHFASESLRQQSPGIPASLRFSKINYVPDLEHIKCEEENAKALGDGAADEWRKGLAARGKKAMADSARWEKWELQLRPGADLAQVLRECDLSSFPQTGGSTQSNNAGVSAAQPSLAPNGTHPLPQPVHVFQDENAALFQQPQQQLLHGLFPPSFSQPQFLQPQSTRQMRNAQEIEEARRVRRTDIERRCMELEPPLEPKVLQHIEPYQAAMQITIPMTDAAWEMLKPRILAQREAAELVEHEKELQRAALRAALPANPFREVTSKAAKEKSDREYELAQEPLRKRLSEYADDYINGQWGGGKMLAKDNAPIFAIHVLLRVQKRWMEDKHHGILPDFENPKKRESSAYGTPPPEPFLSLGNMKWVYDNKVRPLTDIHRREHFICAYCGEERKPKWLAFESLIQHCAVKHITTWSSGNSTVVWPTAEWPEEPPFHTNPVRWLKTDRRKSDFKAHGRNRSTAHKNREDATQASTGPHLPEYPYHPGYGYPMGSSEYTQTPLASHAGQISNHGQELTTTASHEAQLSKLSSDARDVWDALDGIQDLEECIRVHVVIHHTVLRFIEHFQQNPQLDLWTGALTTNNRLRPLKNATGLACKSCVSESNSANQVSYWLRITGAKVYNTFSLISHFKLVHLPPNQTGFLDWASNMIELPDDQMIGGLLRTSGMDDDKLALIAAAFPNAFPNPLPRIGMVMEAHPNAVSDDLPTSKLLDRLGKKGKSQPKKKTRKATNGDQKRNQSQEPLPEPADDEYDPRQPMFFQSKNQVAGPAQYDNKIARIATPEVPAAPVLNAETVAALQNVSAINVPSRHVKIKREDQRSRSPSVGRQTPARESSGSARALPTSQQPDIASILASLTGQAVPSQTSAPSATAGHRPESASHQLYVEQYPNSQYKSPTITQNDNQHSSSRYVDAYYPPREKYEAGGLQELKAALDPNNRQSLQNPYHTYVEMPPAHPMQSTPRNHYVYEPGQHFNAAPTQTLYREAPVQYVRLPGPEFTSYEYRYERVAPQTVYVDQYGHPLQLIPIDAASAPSSMQYVPISYEQQQYGMQSAVHTAVGPEAHLQRVYDGHRSERHETHGGVPLRYAQDDRAPSVGRP